MLIVGVEPRHEARHVRIWGAFGCKVMVSIEGSDDHAIVMDGHMRIEELDAG